MPKKITFKKYQTRNPSYHWQQIKSNLFKFNAYVDARYQQVLNHIPQATNLKILDIGCGDGVLLYLINQKVKAKLTGVDLDQNSLKTARSKLKAKFVKASAYKLPFKTSAFDIIIASEIIEHLDQPQKMLQEIKRVLNPLGTVIITTPIKLFKTPEDPMHYQEFTPDQLTKLIKKYFKSITIQPSHPYILKKLYTTPWLKLDRFYFEPTRWLLNLVYFIFKLNLFYLKKPRPCQQTAIIKQ